MRDLTMETRDNGLDIAIREVEKKILTNPDPFYVKILERLKKIRDS